MSILRPYQEVAASQLLRALQHGKEEWGYAGGVDMSDTGTGKSFIDLFAALQTGRKPVVLCPLVGIPGWLRTHQALKAEPFYVGTPDALKRGGRSHTVERLGNGVFWWKNASDIILILDEAQHFKGMDSIASQMIEGAIAQEIPIICASATLASSPLELMIAGQVTGLHTGGNDWLRFLAENGCRYKEDEERWVWSSKKHVLGQLHHRLIPERGCRVRKADIGEKPACTIATLPIECPEGPSIAAEWSRGMADIANLNKKGYPPQVQIAVRRKIRMRLWKTSEMALVEPLAERIRADLDNNKSVIAFFGFTESRERMGKLLKTRDGFYGGQDTHTRKRLEDQFQADQIRVLLNQIKAGGSSVSLHDLNGDYPRVAYVLPSDSAVAMSQAPGRIDRLGMLTPAHVWIPYVAGTLSEAIVKSTGRKVAQMAQLNDGAPE